MFFAYLLDLNHSLFGTFKYFIDRFLNSDEKSAKENFEKFDDAEKRIKQRYKLNINQHVYVQTEDWIKDDEDAIALKKEMEKLHTLRSSLENDLQVERNHLGEMLDNVCALQRVLHDAREREENYERELKIANEKISALKNTIRTLRSPLHTTIDEIASYKIDKRKFLVSAKSKLEDVSDSEDSTEFSQIVFNGILSMFSNEVEEILVKEESFLRSLENSSFGLNNNMNPDEDFSRINANSNDYTRIMQI